MQAHLDNRALRLVPALILICLLVSGPPAGAQDQPGPAASTKALESDYRIGMGDVIEIKVWKEPDLTTTQTVRLDGKVSFSLVGDLKAVGKTTEELAADLETGLAEFISEPSAAVTLVESKSRRYYMIGQIKSAGEYPINYPLTLLQALARGGGFLEWADKSKVMVVRRDGDREIILNFDYEAFAKGRDLDRNFLIQAGDTIIVP